MSLTDVLKTARAAIDANGWVGPSVEPFCLDPQGCWVIAGDEGAHTLSVEAVLGGDDSRVLAYDLLHRVANPNAARVGDALATGDLVAAMRFMDAAAREFWSFEAWLCAPYRRGEDVLRVLTDAITRSKKTGERR